MTDRYESLSQEAQRLLRCRLNCPDNKTLQEVLAARRLDQVDATLILLDADLLDDVAVLTGVPVVHFPSPEQMDPWRIDNWRTANWHPHTGPAGTTVRQLVARGVTHDHIDELQARGALRLEPCLAHGRMDESVEERSQWLADWVARHPNPNDIDNWRVAYVGTPQWVDHHAIARAVRLGMSVRQLVMRGVSYPQLDGAMKAGWLRLAPR